MPKAWQQKRKNGQSLATEKAEWTKPGNREGRMATEQVEKATIQLLTEKAEFSEHAVVTEYLTVYRQIIQIKCLAPSCPDPVISARNDGCEVMIQRECNSIHLGGIQSNIWGEYKVKLSQPCPYSHCKLCPPTNYEKLKFIQAPLKKDQIFLHASAYSIHSNMPFVCFIYLLICNLINLVGMFHRQVVLGGQLPIKVSE